MHFLHMCPWVITQSCQFSCGPLWAGFPFGVRERWNIQYVGASLPLLSFCLHSFVRPGPWFSQYSQLSHPSHHQSRAACPWRLTRPCNKGSMVIDANGCLALEFGRQQGVGGVVLTGECISYFKGAPLRVQPVVTITS